MPRKNTTHYRQKRTTHQNRRLSSIPEQSLEKRRVDTVSVDNQESLLSQILKINYSTANAKHIVKQYRLISSDQFDRAHEFPSVSARKGGNMPLENMAK